MLKMHGIKKSFYSDPKVFVHVCAYNPVSLTTKEHITSIHNTT